MSELAPRVRHVRVLSERVVELTFADGRQRIVDLAPMLWGPVFAQVAADDAAFAQVIVDGELGTICWPNGADLDPDVLYNTPEIEALRRLRYREPTRLSVSSAELIREDRDER